MGIYLLDIYARRNKHTASNFKSNLNKWKKQEINRDFGWFIILCAICLTFHISLISQITSAELRWVDRRGITGNRSQIEVFLGLLWICHISPKNTHSNSIIYHYVLTDIFSKTRIAITLYRVTRFSFFQLIYRTAQLCSTRHRAEIFSTHSAHLTH